jgi:hypothetical protein
MGWAKAQISGRNLSPSGLRDSAKQDGEHRMKQFRYGIKATGLPIIICGLSIYGCATKKYVSKQIDVVNQHVSQLENRDKAALAQQQSEISHVDERVTTVDNKNW